MALESIPEVVLSSGNSKTMPVLGLGTGGLPIVTPEAVIKAVLEAIELAEALGEAIIQALSLGLIKSCDEVFITSMLWCTNNHGDRVLPALRNTLQTMKLKYLDQYHIHFPVSIKAEANPFEPNPEDVVPMDFKSVWTAMEECQTLGLAKPIGVEMNPAWQQRKLKEFCKENGIMIAAYSPLGAAGSVWGTKGVLGSKVLNEIAKSKGKSVSQVVLRWAYEQGIIIVTKSFNKDRVKQNRELFDWELSDEESKKIAKIPQSRANLAHFLVSETGHIKSVEELWDGEL